MDLPDVVTLPFGDGARDVPQHVATLFRQHRIPTHQLTYEQALARMDWSNADSAVKEAADKIISNHLRLFG